MRSLQHLVYEEHYTVTENLKDSEGNTHKVEVQKTRKIDKWSPIYFSARNILNRFRGLHPNKPEVLLSYEPDTLAEHLRGYLILLGREYKDRESLGFDSPRQEREYVRNLLAFINESTQLLELYAQAHNDEETPDHGITLEELTGFAPEDVAIPDSYKRLDHYAR